MKFFKSFVFITLFTIAFSTSYARRESGDREGTGGTGGTNKVTHLLSKAKNEIISGLESVKDFTEISDNYFSKETVLGKLSLLRFRPAPKSTVIKDTLAGYESWMGWDSAAGVVRHLPQLGDSQDPQQGDVLPFIAEFLESKTLAQVLRDEVAHELAHALDIDDEGEARLFANRLIAILPDPNDLAYRNPYDNIPNLAYIHAEGVGKVKGDLLGPMKSGFLRGLLVPMYTTETAAHLRAQEICIKYDYLGVKKHGTVIHRESGKSIFLNKLSNPKDVAVIDLQGSREFDLVVVKNDEPPKPYLDYGGSVLKNFDVIYAYFTKLICTNEIDELAVSHAHLTQPTSNGTGTCTVNGKCGETTSAINTSIKTFVKEKLR